MGIVIAVDGPAASGKGTLTRSLAGKLGFAALDTGKLYRAVARQVILEGADLADHATCTAAAEALRPEDATGSDLVGEAMGAAASKVAAIPGVRAALLDFQRRFAACPPGSAAGAVLDGRDIGTVVCPDATLKIYLVADLDVRIARRTGEALAADPRTDTDRMARDLRERDERETNRDISPMKPADDAVIVDSTAITAAEVFEQVMAAYERISVPAGPGR